MNDDEHVMSSFVNNPTQLDHNFNNCSSMFELIKTATNTLPTKRKHSSNNSSSMNGASAKAALAAPHLIPFSGSLGAASAAAASSLPDMNDPAVINQFLASLSQHHHQQQQQSATSVSSTGNTTTPTNTSIDAPNKPPKSNALTPAAMDLTAAMSEQLQKQQLAELMFLKQMRSMLGYQSPDAALLPSSMGHETPKGIEKPSSPVLPLTSSPAPGSVQSNMSSQTPTTGTVPPLSSSSPIDPQQASNTPLDHLLQLYGINRESYLKLLQHQEQLKQQNDQAPSQFESSLNSRNMDLHSPPKGLERQQPDEDSSNEDSNDDAKQHDSSQDSAKAFELEKLKQLQSLYKLNMMQQQFQQQQPGQPPSSQAQQQPMSIQTSLPVDMDFSFLSSLKPKKPMSGSASSANSSQDNVSYVEMLHQKATAGGKTPSRRPLSSWKQSISACGPGPAPWVDKSTLYSLGIQGELINRTGPIDYTNFVKRYGNAHECGNPLCRELNYREHFHCNATSCNSRVFMKKEEMIRHFKWHKKRDESLTHGFLRCSPADNCVERFRSCPHHRKQTHYHCLKRGCDKVYISTSDVQMHANYHRKDTSIIHEGFQRFRATENCLLESCAFFGQKTTHFHCRRDNCDHTFKNKADMEKHKSYHVRDEQLARDGFRKFLKHEECCVEACRSSRVCNHIHCIRPGCTHVLHSTGQLYPHKRKHERREYEWSYRKYRLAQALRQNSEVLSSQLEITLNEGLDTLSEDDSVMDNLVAQLPLIQFVPIPLEEIVGESIGDARIRKYLQRHPNAGCQRIDSESASNGMLRTEHFTCSACSRCWSDHADAVQHAHKHALQELAHTLLFEETQDPNICSVECILHQKDRHFHCRMFGCPFVSLIGDNTLTRFEHYKFHEDQMDQFGPNADCEIKLNNNGLQIEGFNHIKSEPSPQQLLQNTSLLHPVTPDNHSSHGKNGSHRNHRNKASSPAALQVFPTGTTLTSVDGLPVLKRKRGRPPKNRASERLNNSEQRLPGTGPFGGLTDGSAGGGGGFDLAAALNLSLAAGRGDELSAIGASLGGGGGGGGKTIPIPLLMNQYLKQNIPVPTQLPSVVGFYAFDDKSPCPDMFCRFFGTPHYHCCRPRCFFSTNRDETAHSHIRELHDTIDILEGFVYFDSGIDCKMPSCNLNRASNHFHCTRPSCNTSFAPYALMRVHDAKHKPEHGGSGAETPIKSESHDWQSQLQNIIAQQAKMMCNKDDEPETPERDDSPDTEEAQKIDDPNMLMMGLQAQFAQNPALAGNLLQMLVSSMMMNQAGTSASGDSVHQESKTEDGESSPRKRRGSFSSEASSAASEYLKRSKLDETSSNRKDHQSMAQKGSLLSPSVGQ